MYLAKYGRATLEKDLALYPRPVVSMLKLGEMYLIASEAAAHVVSTGEALRLLTVLQSSRLGGVFTGTEKEAILVEILKEYRKEFVSLGQLFYFYKRWGVENVVGYANPMGDPEYVLPYPDEEVISGNRVQF